MTVNFGTCNCGARWRQIGNRTGHCSGCHRTFSGITTFDAHQRVHDGRNVCLDPATMLTRDETPRFKTFVDDEGAVVWRPAKDMPAGAFSGVRRG